jgi:hypothetical protein
LCYLEEKNLQTVVCLQSRFLPVLNDGFNVKLEMSYLEAAIQESYILLEISTFWGLFSPM